MKVLITIATLFTIGSVFGWIIEVFFRRFVSQKKWMNPGFMVGPYLPLYGFGTVALYGICYLDFTNLGLAWDIIIKLIIICLAMTLIEYIAGIIFIKGMNLKLWDYSDRWGNIQGIICPLFSFFWMVIGGAYMFLLNPVLVKGIEWISENLIYVFFVGIVVGMMIVDCAYSMHLGLKISKFAKSNKIILKLDELKLAFEQKYKEQNSNIKKKFAGIFKSIETHEEEKAEYLKSYKEKLPKIHRWWKECRLKKKDDESKDEETHE